MTRIVATKSSFTSGEIDPALFGRMDLRVYEEGAAKLRNVIVQRTGGLARRPGTELLTYVPDGKRLFSFERNGSSDLLIFGDGAVHVVRNTLLRQTIVDNELWGGEELRQLDFALVDEAVLVCHPAYKPRLLRRDAAGQWAIHTLEFARANADDDDERVHCPFARFAPSNVTIQPFRLSGGDPTGSGARDADVELRASAPVFTQDHAGTILRIKGRQLLLSAPAPGFDGHVAQARPLEPLEDERQTTNWDEEAFSEAHGWPICAAMHQERLVLGGCPDRPDYLWFSRSSRPFDFDFADGIDDGAIAFRIAAERQHEIRQLFSGRVLQVFTTAGEWTVSGFPLTPGAARVELQTRIGSPAERQIAPADVDGATLFVGATGRDLREFLFTDTEQAYQAADIAVLSRHLMLDPLEMAFDQTRRVLWIPRNDGKCCAVTIDRNSNVAAWSLLETEGSFQALAMHEGGLLMLVERQSGLCLERLSNAAILDHQQTFTSPTPKDGWEGFAQWSGERRFVIADGVALGEIEIDGDEVLIDRAANALTVGLPFVHAIEGLPLDFGARGAAPDAPYRPVRISLRVGSTDSLTLDAGAGFRALDLGGPHDADRTQDVSVRALGWRRGLQYPPWRITQQAPGALNLLSVTVEAKVNI
ncbi:MAG: hypothetical protein R3D28_01055 [Geminicoccaceae bacterium]|jgi:hypothetical protein|nr:hypothetical protein [Geminicoccaceae bacterium]MCB9941984.1 hypothetical protein [Planctomycetaceae bacterium]